MFIWKENHVCNEIEFENNIQTGEAISVEQLR